MNRTTMNKDQIAAEALERFEKAIETDGPPLDQFERSQFLESVKAAIKKATKPKDEALLRIFEWASRNAPYPECKIEGNTLLQDICERGLGYWPPSRASRESEEEESFAPFFKDAERKSDAELTKLVEGDEQQSAATKRLEGWLDRLLTAVEAQRWPSCNSLSELHLVAADIEGERIAERAIDAEIHASDVAYNARQIERCKRILGI